MSIHTLRKRFVRDQSLPIQIVQSPYFEYLISLYETIYKSETLYNEFLKEVELRGGEEQFFQYYNEVKDRILSHIKQKESFKQFNNEKLDKYDVKNGISKSKLYHPDNHNKRFISIDLKKANFQALRFIDKEIVDGFKDYNEWMGQFTDSQYIIKSKYIRQVIFGNLNPKRQQKIQKYIMNQFVQVILKHFPEDDVMSASSDEIVIAYNEEVNLDDFKQELNKVFNGEVDIHLQAFNLHMQDFHNQYGYVKEFLKSEEIEFKSVPALFMPQAYKHYLKQEITKEDLAFYHEGFVAHFAKSVPESQ